VNAQKLGYLLPLSEVCEVNPRNVTGLDPDTSVTFVPMSAVDERTGSILTPEIRDYQEVAKGYTPFRNNDVLFAKITPCMENGKCAIARRLENGWDFGSTEFHILRAGDRVLPEWVYYFIRQEEVRKFAASNMTGTAGQQRVPKSVFDRLLISVPPFPSKSESPPS
jgi:type I restriction enzyme S subunit